MRTKEQWTAAINAAEDAQTLHDLAHALVAECVPQKTSDEDWMTVKVNRANCENLNRDLLKFLVGTEYYVEITFKAGNLVKGYMKAINLTDDTITLDDSDRRLGKADGDVRRTYVLSDIATLEIP